MNTHYDNMINSGIMLLANEEISNQNALTQKESRLSIDEAVCHQLEGNALKDSLFIIDNIIENKMKINWSSYNVWSVQYKRKHVCDLSIVKGSLVIGEISEALITYVKTKSRNQESLMQLIETMLSTMPRTQKAYAMQ